MKKILFFFITIAVFSACQNKKTSKMVDRIDSLSVVLSKAKEEFQKIDTAQINTYIRTAEEDLDYLQKNKKDTATKEQAFIFSDYVGNKRSFSKLIKQHRSLAAEVDFSEKQLNTYKADVENNLISEQDLLTFYVSEEKAISSLVEALDGASIWYKSSTEKRQRLEPKIKEMMAQIAQSEH